MNALVYHYYGCAWPVAICRILLSQISLHALEANSISSRAFSQKIHLMQVRIIEYFLQYIDLNFNYFCGIPFTISVTVCKRPMIHVEEVQTKI